MSTMSLLDATGDTTISWSEDRDEEMERIIEKKMSQGVTFFVVERHGARPAERLKSASDARRHRSLAVPDEDIAKFLESGGGEVVSAPAAPVKRSRISRDAKEVSKSDSIGVQQRRGG